MVAISPYLLDGNVSIASENEEFTPDILFSACSKNWYLEYGRG